MRKSFAVMGLLVASLLPAVAAARDRDDDHERHERNERRQEQRMRQNRQPYYGNQPYGYYGNQPYTYGQPYRYGRPYSGDQRQREQHRDYR